MGTLSNSKRVATEHDLTTVAMSDDDDDFLESTLSYSLSSIQPTATKSTTLRRPKSSRCFSLRHGQPLKSSKWASSGSGLGPCNQRSELSSSDISSISGKENAIPWSQSHPSVSVSAEDELLIRPSLRALDFAFGSKAASLSLQSSSKRSGHDGGAPFSFHPRPTKRKQESQRATDTRQGYESNSVEPRLLDSREDGRLDINACSVEVKGDEDSNNNVTGAPLEVLVKLCSGVGGCLSEAPSGVGNTSDCTMIPCPLCGTDISGLSNELRHHHTNICLDKMENPVLLISSSETRLETPCEGVDDSPVLKWLCSLGLERYEEVFRQEEIDWDMLQWLTEEDLVNMGVTALGPRKKIVHALRELRGGSLAPGRNKDTSKPLVNDLGDAAANRLITDYFASSVNKRNINGSTLRGQHAAEKRRRGSGCKQAVVKNNHARNGKLWNIPIWCIIPGTSFRVDAFQYLGRDCSHWFLTHFHIDHYQGLTRTFCHGKIYCSSITAKLVNMKIGISWDKFEVLPLNQKINIDGIDVTCLNANHCPGSIMILFEPPNGKAVLHTGDFRFTEEMLGSSVLQMCHVHTLILDTTYCNPRFDFPKQEAVMQFVIEAIQAEAFNPKTLFLIGSYTIGKERLFLEVAHVLRKKVYVNAPKLQLLQCLGFAEEDMQWFTSNDQESNIHVVPLWTVASFKRLKHISNQYRVSYSEIFFALNFDFVLH
ncbi:Sterile alpha motif domain, partial [Dillenia turbinata]